MKRLNIKIWNNTNKFYNKEVQGYNFPRWRFERKCDTPDKKAQIKKINQIELNYFYWKKI